MKLSSVFLIAFLFLIPEMGMTQNAGSNELSHPILTSKFIINAGLYFPAKSIRISANGSSVINDEIDFGKTFSFNKNETTFAGNFIWRFSRNKRWSGSYEYFRVKNKGEARLEREIEWKDNTYPVGAEVKAGVGFYLNRIFFGYAISQGAKHEFGAGLGFHILDISTYLEGDGYAGEGGITFDLDRKSANTIAPVPNIGLWYYWAPDHKWALTARVDYFSLKVDTINGSLWNVAPGIKFQAWEHLGFGVNYRFFKVKITEDARAFDGALNLRFNGPLVTLSGNF